jgi:hypothetical protein
MTGSFTASLIRRICSRYSSGPRRYSRLRKIRQRLGEGVGVDLHRLDRPDLFARDLLLEEGVHHDARSAGVLEALDRVEVVHHRRGAGHERVRELEAEVGGREVHRVLLRPPAPSAPE